MVDREQNRAGAGRRADAVERLYAYWLGSVVLLALAVLILAFFLRGALRQVQSLRDDVANLNTGVAELNDAFELLADLPSEWPPPRPPRVPQPPDEAEAPAAEPPPATTTAPTEPDNVAEATDNEPPLPDDAEVRVGLEELVARDAITGWCVVDGPRARELTRQALADGDRVSWNGGTWADLATLARLVRQDTAADAFAEHARMGGAPLDAFIRISARSLLARGKLAAARAYAEQWLKQNEAAPAALAVLAQVAWLSEQPAAADEALRQIHTLDELGILDRLRIARLCLELEHWGRLAQAVDSLGEVPDALSAESNFLRAVSLAERDRTVEALAILDYLVAHPEPIDTDPPAPWPLPHPDPYDVLVWRGTALRVADQLDAAREALDQAAAARPGRPEAPYERGMLEIHAGRPEVATEYLKNALANAARFAPAWEALGLVALNAGDIDSALTNLKHAVDINPRRASTQFLTAIAYARIGAADDAAAALRATFALEPTYLQEAQQTDALLRLFTADELAAIAQPAAAQPPQPEAAPAAQPE